VPGQGELATFLGQVTAGTGVPYNSGPVILPPATQGLQTKLGLPLSVDGQRTLCATIAMMSGSYGATDPTGNGYTGPWMNNLLWQGAANVGNAISATIASGKTSVTAPQQFALCRVAKAVWSFTTLTTATTYTDDVAVTVPQVNTAGTGTGADYSCFTDGGLCTLSSPWNFVSTPTLAAAPNNFGLGSATYAQCVTKLQAW